MSAIEKINLSHRASLWYKTANTRMTVPSQDKKNNLDPMIKHCSIIMKTINELEPIKQAFLAQEVLNSLREMQFFQDSLTSQRALQHVDNKFEDALTLLAKTLLANECLSKPMTLGSGFKPISVN